MEHKGTVILETEKLILRRFEAADAPRMFENWASDPCVTRYLTWPPHESVADTACLIDAWVREYARADFYQWTIELKEIGEPIGSISVVRSEERVSELEIGYCIGKRWWRKGYTSEALARVIPFLIGEVGARRISAKHDTNNPGSGAVMRKCGMTYEGTLRKAGMNSTGEICDLAVYALLAE